VRNVYFVSCYVSRQLNPGSHGNCCLSRVCVWSAVRIHLALKACHELLNCICAMEQSEDPAVRNSAQVIKGVRTDLTTFCSSLITFVIIYTRLHTAFSAFTL